jgi:hypothetical protein
MWKGSLLTDVTRSRQYGIFAFERTFSNELIKVKFNSLEAFNNNACSKREKIK